LGFLIFSLEDLSSSLEIPVLNITPQARNVKLKLDIAYNARNKVNAEKTHKSAIILNSPALQTIHAATAKQAVNVWSEIQSDKTTKKFATCRRKETHMRNVFIALVMRTVKEIFHFVRGLRICVQPAPKMKNAGHGPTQNATQPLPIIFSRREDSAFIVLPTLNVQEQLHFAIIQEHVWDALRMQNVSSKILIHHFVPQVGHFLDLVLIAKHLQIAL